MVSIRVMEFHYATATHPVLWCFETDHSFFLPSSSGINSGIATIGHPCQMKTVTAHLVVLMTGLISARALPKHFHKSLWSCGWVIPWTNKTRCVLPRKKNPKQILNFWMASHSPIYTRSHRPMDGCYHEPLESTTLRLLTRSSLYELIDSFQKQSKTKWCHTVFFFRVNHLKMTNLSARGNGRRQWDNGEALRVCGR